jgi:hypothetical protein
LHNRPPWEYFGLGLPFAIEYRKQHPGAVVGLIPVAIGGSAIDRMNKGSAVYADALKKARWAMERGTIKGVLWHQGESDTTKAEDAAAYDGKLRQLIADVRGDLGNAELPFIIGNLAEFYGTGPDHNAPDRVRRIEQVREALRSVAKDVPCAGFVESTGLSSIDKHMVHFDRQSYILLGQRYAQVHGKVSAGRHGDAK